MRTGLGRRVVSLSAVFMAFALVGAPAVAADGNVAPAVTAYAVNSTFAEPMIEVGMALISDPDSSSFTCSINFGDGTPAVPGIVSDTVCSWPEHRYAASGTYTIVVTATDNWGASGEGTATVTYTNAAPGVSVPSLVGTPQVGSPVHASAAFLDFGTGDDVGTPVFETYTCTIDYGDGTPVQAGTYVPRSSGQFPTCVGFDHVYEAPAAYTIMVTVTDNGGAAGSNQMVTTIASAPDTGPVLTVPPTSHPMVTEGVPGTFQWWLVDPAPDLPYSMHVDWGDGSSGDLTSATSPAEIDLTHTYAASDRVGAPGYSLYTATLTVTDARGATASASQQVEVINLAPVIAAPASVTVPEGPATTITLATFTDASVGPWQVYVWTSDGRFLHLTYQTPSAIRVPWDPSWGNLTVTIEVWDRGLMGSTATIAIVVANSAPAVGAISFYQGTQPAEGQLFAAVAEFTDPGLSSWPGSETYTCTVDYGDGTGPQAGSAGGGICYGPVHTYAAPGSYVISVVVTDSNGGSGWNALSVTAANVAPTVGPIYIDPVSEGQAATAAAPFSDPGIAGETYSCTVDYGDGSGALPGVVDGTGCIGPSHVYARAGVLTVTVTVTDSSGATGSASTMTFVDNVMPVVETISVAPAFQGQATSATAMFSDPGNAVETYTCTVDYGDGTGDLPGVVSGSSCTGPSHVYAWTGTYTVTVTVTDSNGATGFGWTTASVSNASPVIGTVSVAPASEGQATSATATFSDPGSAVETHTCTVDYGDGTGTLAGVVSGHSCTGPSHVYARTGTYTVTVTVMDSNGASGSASATVSVANVAPAISSVSVTPSPAKVGSSVKASAVFVDPGTAETYTATWSWGDGTTTVVSLASSVRSVTASHAYAKAGLYAVGLTVSDGTGAGSASSPQVVVYDPARALSGSGMVTSPAGACKLSTKCSAASTATFSVTASYARGATKPTVKLTYSAACFSFSATGADWFVAANGTATIQGTGKVNGVAGYTFRLTVVDGRPDALRLQVWSSSGALVYDNGSTAPLKSGSITIR